MGKIDDSDDVTLFKARRGRGRMPGAAIEDVLLQDSAYKGRLSFNEAKNEVFLDNRAITQGDYGRIQNQIQRKYRFAEVGSGALRNAVYLVALNKSFNPIRDYLEGLEWDGVRRLTTLPKLLGCEMNEPLLSRYCEVWFTAAVARTYEPGCKVECVLVLDGEQGSFKSTFFAAIASGPGPDYFCDNHIDITSRDGLDLLNGSWIIEWAEFEGILNGKSPGEVKQFLSVQTDRYRPAYAVSKITVQRRCVFCASTNCREFFRDSTGNRRFFVIPTGMIDLDAVRVQRDQLWAEAVVRYKSGERYYLNHDEMRAQATLNASFNVGAAKFDALKALLGDKSEILSADIPVLRETLGCTEMTLQKMLREQGWAPERVRRDSAQVRIWKRTSH